MQVGIIGLGNLGTAVGHLLTENGYSVLGWEYNQAVVDGINQHHLNTRYLPDIPLNPTLRATNSLSDLFQHSEIVFIAIPSAYVNPTLQSALPDIRDEVLLVNMAKGIDGETGLTSFQMLNSLLPKNPKVMLSGPSIANEFVHGMPTVVVIAGSEPSALQQVAHLLDNNHFRTRFSDDVIGVELGGILKNIYAIGLGLFDGQAISSINFRSVYLTIALEEMSRIGISYGAKIDTFLYLSGMGDLLATALSEHSHNRRMGELLGQGLPLDEIEQKMGVLPEGYNTLKVILYVAEKMHVSLPLARGLWDVINGRYQAKQFIFSFIKDFVE